MRSLEIQIGDKIAKVELLGRKGSELKMKVDDRVYEPDIIMVERGVYSILLDGRSYNVELIETTGPKQYQVNTLFYTFDAEVVDAETKYLKSRRKIDGLEDNIISSPMPGKVVKILVRPGEEVKAGETVVIVSAMKMESEYKVKKDRLIKEIRVKEGDTVSANQPLIIIE
ncbi:MAG: biotin/lipoyl-containing protein [Bacteroidales bacterium]|jgi:biotin carboxyl carrier protein|nr:biotin/lipoyl-containing protein [Bacteroidales bacterium]